MPGRIRFIGNRYKVIADPSEIPEEIVKTSVYLHEGVENTSIALCRAGSRPTLPWPGLSGSTLTTANKGIGVQSLCRVLGIAPDEVMAFGDNFNDVSMLDIVDTPYIMDKAPPLRCAPVIRCTPRARGRAAGFSCKMTPNNKISHVMAFRCSPCRKFFNKFTKD